MDTDKERRYNQLCDKEKQVGFKNLSLNDRNELRDLHGEYEDKKYRYKFRQSHEGYVQDYPTIPD